MHKINWVIYSVYYQHDLLYWFARTIVQLIDYNYRPCISIPDKPFHSGTKNIFWIFFILIKMSFKWYELELFFLSKCKFQGGKNEVSYTAHFFKRIFFIFLSIKLHCVWAARLYDEHQIRNTIKSAPDKVQKIRVNLLKNYSF